MSASYYGWMGASVVVALLGAAWWWGCAAQTVNHPKESLNSETVSALSLKAETFFTDYREDCVRGMLGDKELMAAYPDADPERIGLYCDCYTEELRDMVRIQRRKLADLEQGIPKNEADEIAVGCAIHLEGISMPEIEGEPSAVIATPKTDP